MNNFLKICSFVFFFIIGGNVVGQQHIDIVRQYDSLNTVITTAFKNRDFSNIQYLINRQDTFVDRHFGQESKERGQLIYLKGLQYYFSGKYSQALEAFENAMQIRKLTVGEKDEIYYRCFANIGSIYYVQRNYIKALEIYKGALKIGTALFGETSSHVAKDLGNLGICYKEMGNYEKALDFNIKSLNLKLLLDSTDIISCATSYQHVALLYVSIGDNEKAEMYYNEALNYFIRSPKLKNSIDYCIILNNTASFYTKMSNFSLAQKYILESENIFENNIELKKGPYYLTALMSFSDFYSSLKIKDKAENYIDLRLKSAAESFGSKSREHALALMSKGKMCNINLEFEESLMYYSKANSILDSIQGNQDYNKAICLYAIALQHLSLQDTTTFIDATHSVYSFAQQKSITKFPGLYSSILISEAIAQAANNNMELAESHLLRALTLRDSLYGKFNAEYLSARLNIIRVFLQKGNYEKAVPYLQDLSEIYQTILKNVYYYLAPSDLEEYVNGFNEYFQLINQFAELYQTPELSSLALNNAMFFKEVILKKLHVLATHYENNPELRQQWNVIKKLKERISQIETKSIEFQDTVLLRELTNQYNLLEQDLLRNQQDIKSNENLVHWKNAQNKLQEEGVLVDFVRYKANSDHKSDTYHYAAILLKRNSDAPQFVYICTEEELKSLFGNFANKRLEYVSKLYSNSNESGSNLYQLIWKKIENHVWGSKTIEYALAGLLHNINFDWIALPSGKMLAEEYHLKLHSNTIDFNMDDNSKTLANTLQWLGFGDIEYYLEHQESIASLTSPSTIPANDQQLAFRSIDYLPADSTLTRQSWKSLKGSKIELQEIQTICNSVGSKHKKYSGREATEERFKALELESRNSIDPIILHISTHGFFFPESVSNQSTSSLGIVSSMNPMMRSGLILAGGNYAWQNGKPYSQVQEDGILTAYEISLLNLKNVELVVLSACETGLGEAKSNEGVYGLQRAFKIAGVKNIIMSLWQVPDKQTAQLMTLFYSNWLKEKMSIHQALKSAQLTMKAKGLEPYYWAGFVLME